MLHLFLPYELGKILFFEFLDGNALLIGIGINEGFVHVFQVVLDFVVGRADDGLEAESAYQSIQLATFSASILEKASSSTTRRMVGLRDSLGDRLI